MSVKDFILLSKLGQGAYSTVYKVQRLADHQIYALKKVKLGNLSDKQAQNALNQVRILASIHHQNIISYKQAFLEGKNLCIVMQFADDGDLYHKISDNKKKKKYFQQNLIWKLIINMLRGLKELHDLKILHRDIKTANIFLNKNGTAQLGDMNVSKIAENGLLYTQTGTPYYASPQVWSQSPYDSKSDIWSLGCVLYETAALEVPFKAEDMEGLMNTVLKGKFQSIPNIFSKELSQFINQMLQLKPKQRPSCQRMLKSSIIQRKIEQLQLEFKDISKGQKQLLQTIKMPKKLQYLTDRLPKSNYSLNKSYDQAIYTLEQSKKKTRQRTNTLPKLQRVIRYHQDIIHKRKKANKQSIIDQKNQALYVAGISKSINQIKVGLPDRKDRINQEISRIYQGKHAVYRNQNTRDYNLLGMRK